MSGSAATMRFAVVRADGPDDGLVGVVREAVRDAAGAADRKGDRLRRVLRDEIGERFRERNRLVRRVEEPLDVLFRVAGDGGADEAGRARVRKDEDVAAADVGARRCHELGERVVVELLGDDDPHADAVGAHHGEQHLVAAREPALADGDLPRHRERRRGRREGLCRGLRRGGSGQEQEDGGPKEQRRAANGRQIEQSSSHLARGWAGRAVKPGVTSCGMRWGGRTPARHLTAISSISKISVANGPTSAPAPRSAYTSFGGMNTCTWNRRASTAAPRSSP